MGSRPCCCIPNRAATIVLSLGAIIVAALLLTGTVMVITTNAMNKPLIIPSIIFGFTNLLLFVSSLVGFIGAIMRKRRAVAFYAVVLTILWVCTLFIGVWNIVVLFKNRQSVIESCIAKTYAQTQSSGPAFDQSVANAECTKAHNILAGVFVGVWVAYQLIALWVMSTVYALRRDLWESEMANQRYLEQAYPVSGPVINVNGSSGASMHSRTSEESKMSSRSGPVVSVPYRPSGNRAPMGPYRA